MMHEWGDRSDKVDIFLAEGLVSDAITLVRGQDRGGDLLRVLEAAIPTHSDWVIDKATRSAEAIVDAKKTEHYDWAVTCLQQVKAAVESEIQV